MTFMKTQNYTVLPSIEDYSKGSEEYEFSEKLVENILGDTVY